MHEVLAFGDLQSLVPSDKMRTRSSVLGPFRQNANETVMSEAQLFGDDMLESESEETRRGHHGVI